MTGTIDFRSFLSIILNLSCDSYRVLIINKYIEKLLYYCRQKKFRKLKQLKINISDKCIDNIEKK